MKINIGTSKGNIVGVETNKPYKDLTYSDVCQLIPESYKKDGLISVYGWCETSNKDIRRKKLEAIKQQEAKLVNSGEVSIYDNLSEEELLKRRGEIESEVEALLTSLNRIENVLFYKKNPECKK